MLMAYYPFTYYNKNTITKFFNFADHYKTSRFTVTDIRLGMVDEENVDRFSIYKASFILPKSVLSLAAPSYLLHYSFSLIFDYDNYSGKIGVYTKSTFRDNYYINYFFMEYDLFNNTIKAYTTEFDLVLGQTPNVYFHQNNAINQKVEYIVLAIIYMSSTLSTTSSSNTQHLFYKIENSIGDYDQRNVTMNISRRNYHDETQMYWLYGNIQNQMMTVQIFLIEILLY